MSTTPVSPKDFFLKSRAEHAGSTAQHRAVHCGLACPSDKDGKVCDQPLYASMSGKYSCSNGHEFRDHDELMKLSPRKIDIPKLVAKQDHYREVKLQVPEEIVAALQTRFGEKLAPTLAAILGVLVEPKSFIINGVDIERITKQTGVEFKNSSELVGTFFSLKEQLKLLQDQIAQVNAGAESVGGIPVMFDAETMALIRPKAREANRSVNDWISETITLWVRNGWI
jgi:hypothetical protein